MSKLTDTLRHLDSFALGVAIGFLALVSPDVVRDMVRVVDSGSFVSLAQRLWHAFSSGVVPMSVGAAVSLWLRGRAGVMAHGPNSWRAVAGGFLTAAFGASLDRFAGLGQVPVGEWERVILLASLGAAGMLAVLRRPRANASPSATPNEELKPTATPSSLVG